MMKSLLCLGAAGQPQSTRRGAILLVVLAVLVLVLGMTTAWVTAIGPMHAESRHTTEHLLQSQMLANGELLAQAWIRTHGSQAIAPEQGGGWTVVDDHLHQAVGDVRLQVTIFDGWSGLPAPLLHVRGTLRRELPSALGSLEIPPLASQDEEKLLGPQDLLEILNIPLGVRRFPDPGWHTGIGVHWRAPDERRNIVTDTPVSTNDGMEVLALAISPHSDGRINLNTAPVRLVETVCRLRGIGVPEHLRNNRRHGLRTAVPAGADDGDPRLPRLVDQTLVWNCLISVTCAAHTRTWWVVVVGNSNNLRIVQRHDADA